MAFPFCLEIKLYLQLNRFLCSFNHIPRGSKATRFYLKLNILVADRFFKRKLDITFKLRATDLFHAI